MSVFVKHQIIEYEKNMDILNLWVANNEKFIYVHKFAYTLS